MEHLYNYQRSQNIDILKHTKETISGNFSSEQYISTIDILLFNCIDGILRSSDYLDECISSFMLMHIYSKNNKHSSFKKELTLSLCAKFLAADDCDTKLKILKAVKLHRNHPILFIEKWLEKTKKYRILYLKKQSVSHIEKSVCHKKGKHDSLFACIASVNYWFHLLLELKAIVLEKYHRLIVRESVNVYKTISYSSNLDDIVQLLSLEAIRALDRCNIEKGPITPYMQRLLRFAGNKIDFESDSAYIVKGNKGNYRHKSVELSENTQSIDGSDDTGDLDHVRKIAKIIDPDGAARYYLNIDEVFAP